MILLMDDSSFDAWVLELQKKFNIHDRDNLEAALRRAFDAYVVAEDGDDGERDTLDALAQHLTKAIALIDPYTPPIDRWVAQLDKHKKPDLMFVIRNQLRLRYELPEQALGVDQFCIQLKLYKDVAEQAHREREPRRGPLPDRVTRVAFDVLYHYWVDVLGRAFTHSPWVNGNGNRPAPITDGERFISEIIQKYIAPDRDEDELGKKLQTIAREFVQRQ